MGSRSLLLVPALLSMTRSAALACGGEVCSLSARYLMGSAHCSVARQGRVCGGQRCAQRAQRGLEVPSQKNSGRPVVAAGRGRGPTSVGQVEKTSRLSLGTLGTLALATPVSDCFERRWLGRSCRTDGIADHCILLFAGCAIIGGGSEGSGGAEEMPVSKQFLGRGTRRS